jgi:hypothetical protein
VSRIVGIGAPHRWCTESCSRRAPSSTPAEPVSGALVGVPPPCLTPPSSARTLDGVRSLSLAVLLLALLMGITAACAAAPDLAPTASDPAGERTPGATTTPPVPGRELYGYVPYWEMDRGIAAHLEATPLTTIALFSVTHTSSGALATRQQGYRRITGEVGEAIVREARERGVRTEVVFSSFGAARNRHLFEDAGLQEALVTSLVAFVERTGTDGVNVDVEVLDPILVPAFGAWVARLREALRDADPAHQVSVATGAGPLGAAMALAAAEADADRIFLMGYDYRVAASSPGASAPIDRSDGGERSLRWSLDVYAALGVPAEKLLLGLPLYGMTWPVAGPVIGAPETGRGEAWIPRRNRELLLDDEVVPDRDEIEQVEVYLMGSDGSVGAPSPGLPLATGLLDRTWTAIYVDSPATLAPKLALANERGLAGSGFWAIGYERGLPGYAELMTEFVEGG